MKVTGKIFMWISAIIIIAHTIIPHQHEAQIKNIIHACLFSDSTNNSHSSNIFEKLEDVVKHINLGEKHLEDFKISNYEYEISISQFFDVFPILSLYKHIPTSHKHSYEFYYGLFYKTEINKLSNGLRAPPCV